MTKSSLSFFFATVFVLGAALFSEAALAQANLPTTVQPGRVQSDLQKQTAPASLATPEDLTTSPEVEAPAGADKVFFVLKNVQITGSKRLGTAQLSKAYTGSIGQKISLAHVYTIANKITRIYRDNGYILAHAVVPKQEISNGSITIQIVEGFVSSYHFQGNLRGNDKELRAYADKLVGSGPLTSKNLERYLLLMNDLPGMKVRAVLAPSQTTVGGADLALIVDQTQVQALASVDNYGNSFLGPVRLTGGLQLNSPFKSSDQWNGTILVAPDHYELQYYSLGIKKNIGSEGTKIGLTGNYVDTKPSLPPALGGLLDPSGDSYDVTATIDHPFIRTRDFNVSAGLSFDVTQDETDFAPGLGAIETNDNQRIIRANTQISYLDNWAGYNTFSGYLSQGLDLFGASNEGSLNLSRPAGDPQFTKFSGVASRLQRIYGPFTGLLGVEAQYSFDPLLASEEFGFGGSDFGRGYDFSEITGDSGLAGKLELIYSHTQGYKYLNAYQLYAFYDLGKVWNRDPAAGQDDSDSAASTGIGTRLTITPALHGDAFVAKPLTRDVVSRGDDGDDLRFKFSISTNF